MTTFEIQTQNLAFRGNAVGHLPSGKVVFVRNGAPEEVVRIKIINEKASFATAQIDSIIEKSPLRVEPICKIATQCGGCRWMHINLDAQRSWKSSLVQEELCRALSAPIKLEPTIVGSPLSYRIRCRLHRKGKDFGTLKAFSHDVVPFKRCPVLSPELERFASTVAECLKNCPDCDAEIELSVDSKKRKGLHIKDVPKSTLDMWKNLAHETSADSAVLRWKDSKKPFFIKGSTLSECSLDQQLAVEPGLFVQANREMNAKLVSKVIESAGSGQNFVETYAGIGNFTVHLASQFKQGLVTESEPRAISLLRQKLKNSGNIHVKCVAEADHLSVKRILNLDAPEVFIADPPRAGIKPLRKVFELRPPQRVVLVSCDPMSAVRDIEHLCTTAGYTLKKVIPFDLFPQTHHIELLSILDR